MRSHRGNTLAIVPALRVASIAVVLLCVGPVPVPAAGKPGSPDRITWSGITWSIKTSQSAVGPGPNIFDKSNVWADTSGRLHLRIAKNALGQWTTAEIIAPTTYGYGTYSFTVGSRTDDLDPNVVLGLFTWSDRPQYAHREIDIEFARWGNASDPTNAQYVVQPYDRPAHLRRFTQPAETTSLQRFAWQPGRIDWDSYGSSGGLIDSYRYTGTDVPKSGDERVHLNFWLFNGAPPASGAAAEVVISSFSFAP